MRVLWRCGPGRRVGGLDFGAGVVVTLGWRRAGASTGQLGGCIGSGTAAGGSSASGANLLLVSTSFGENTVGCLFWRASSLRTWPRLRVAIGLTMAAERILQSRPQREVTTGPPPVPPAEGDPVAPATPSSPLLQPAPTPEWPPPNPTFLEAIKNALAWHPPLGQTGLQNQVDGIGRPDEPRDPRVV